MLKIKPHDDWRHDRDDRIDKIIDALQANWREVIEPKTIQKKDVDKERGLKMFIKQCFNRTTDHTKCQYCEFRFQCFTETKNDKTKV